MLKIYPCSEWAESFPTWHMHICKCEILCPFSDWNISWGFQTEIISLFVFFNVQKKIFLSTLKMNDKIKIDLSQFIVANYIIHE